MEPRPNILRSGGAPLPKGRASSVREIVESQPEYKAFYEACDTALKCYVDVVAAAETMSLRLERMRLAIEKQIAELGVS